MPAENIISFFDLIKFADRRSHIDRNTQPIEIFYLRNRDNVSRLLDPKKGHYKTNYETIVFIPSLNDLIGKSPLFYSDFRKKWDSGVPLNILQTLTNVANSDDQFDWFKGVPERLKYIQACNRAIAFLKQKSENFKGQIVTGIGPAGKIIVDSMELQIDLDGKKTKPLIVDAERLFFKTIVTPSYGINIPYDIPGEYINKPVALINVNLDPGLTASAFFALKELGFSEINTYNVVASPVAKAWLSQIRIDLGLRGADLGLYEGGQFNDDLELVYALMDPIIDEYRIGDVGKLIVGNYNSLTDISESTQFI